MAKMKLNIKMFDMEGAFDPSCYNTLVTDYDNDIPKVNNAFVKNQEAMQVFKNVAGSPRLSEGTQDIVRSINEVVDLSVDYFDSVNEWSNGVSETVDGVLGYGIPTMSSKVDRTVLDQIDQNFQGGNIGIENFSDSQTYIEGIQEVLNLSEEALNTMTSDVEAADNSLPGAVHSALNQAISTNNDAVFETYSKVNNYMSENIEEFTTQLQGAIDDMAQAANGEVA